jgi:hypothetical protein
MRVLGSTCTLDESCATVVLLRGGEVVKPHFYLAPKKQHIHTDKGKELCTPTMWNGYGGKWKKGDKNIYTTARRELYEESGGVRVRVKDLVVGARVKFFWPNNTTKVRDMEVFFFTTYLYSKYPEETEEMGYPRLFSVYEAPYKDMMPADDVIFPLILSGKTVTGEIHFKKDEDGKVLVAHKELIISYSQTLMVGM